MSPPVETKSAGCDRLILAVHDWFNRRAPWIRVQKIMEEDWVQEIIAQRDSR